MHHLMSYPKMTLEEFRVLTKELSHMYEIVRLIDVNKQKIVTFNEDGSLNYEENTHCFAAMGKTKRCENCTSAKAYGTHKHCSKFEFYNNEIYHITSQYLTIDDQPYVLELVEDETDTTVVFGRDEFVEKIINYNNDLYTDSLTGVYNRRYLDDQIAGLDMDVTAIVDIDDFKVINDTYGHVAGDEALKAVATTIQKSVRSEDSVLRFGGDEFVITFATMDSKFIENKLNRMREDIEKISFAEYKEMKLSVSIGAVSGNGKVSDHLQLADKELYKAKENKNEISVVYK